MCCPNSLAVYVAFASFLASLTLNGQIKFDSHVIVFIFISVLYSIAAARHHHHSQHHRLHENAYQNNSTDDVALIHHNKKPTFVYADSLGNTQRQESSKFNRKRVVCSCGRTFVHTQSYSYHKNTECGLVFPCPECPSVLATKSNWTKHLRMIHKIKSDRSYKS